MLIFGVLADKYCRKKKVFRKFKRSFKHYRFAEELLNLKYWAFLGKSSGGTSWNSIELAEFLEFCWNLNPRFNGKTGKKFCHVNLFYKITLQCGVETEEAKSLVFNLKDFAINHLNVRVCLSVCNAKFEDWVLNS